MVFSLSFQRRLNFDEQEIRVLRSEVDRVGAPTLADDLLEDALAEIQASRSLLRTDPERAFQAGQQAESAYLRAQRILYASQERSFNRWSTAARVDFWASEALTHGGLAYFNPVLALAFAAGPNLAYVAYVDDQFEVMREGVSRMALHPLQNPLNDEANEALIRTDPSFPNARFGDYFVRRQLDDLRGNRQITAETRRDLQEHWRRIQEAVRDYRPDRRLSEEERIVAVAQQIYYEAHLGSYQRGQPSLLDWFEHGGGNCKLRARVYASLLAESPVIRPPWRITMRYYDGDAENDGHQEVILYNTATGRMLNPKSGEAFSESDSPLFDARTLYTEDLIQHGQDPIHDFSHFLVYTPPGWSLARYDSGERDGQAASPTGDRQSPEVSLADAGLSPGFNGDAGTSSDAAQPASATDAAVEPSTQGAVSQSNPVPRPVEGRLARARVGVVGHRGHAPERTTTPPPLLREFRARERLQRPVADDLPSDMPREKVEYLLNPPLLFVGSEEEVYDRYAFEAGVPFRTHDETRQIQFASYPFYQRFRSLRSGQRRLDYLRALSEQYLARNPASQRAARFMLEDSGNFMLYTPEQIFEAADYLLGAQVFRGGISLFRDDVAVPDVRRATAFFNANSPARLIEIVNRMPLYARSRIFAFLNIAHRLKSDDEASFHSLSTELLQAALPRLPASGENERQRIQRPLSRVNVLMGGFDSLSRGFRGMFSTPQASSVGGDRTASAAPLSEETIFALLTRASAGMGLLQSPFSDLSADESRALARYIRRAVGAPAHQRLAHHSPQEWELMIRLNRLRAASEEEAELAEAQMRGDYARLPYIQNFSQYIEMHLNLLILLGQGEGNAP